MLCAFIYLTLCMVLLCMTLLTILPHGARVGAISSPSPTDVLPVNLQQTNKHAVVKEFYDLLLGVSAVSLLSRSPEFGYLSGSLCL